LPVRCTTSRMAWWSSSASANSRSSRDSTPGSSRDWTFELLRPHNCVERGRGAARKSTHPPETSRRIGHPDTRRHARVRVAGAPPDYGVSRLQRSKFVRFSRSFRSGLAYAAPTATGHDEALRSANRKVGVPGACRYPTLPQMRERWGTQPVAGRPPGGRGCSRRSEAADVFRSPCERMKWNRAHLPAAWLPALRLGRLARCPSH
jgi:hypothetical protein